MFEKWDPANPQIFNPFWTSTPDVKRRALMKTSYRFGEGRAPHLASYVNWNRSPVCLSNIPVWDREARLMG